MIYPIIVTQFAKMLGNMAKVLDKAALFAANKKVDESVLWSSRLAIDQFNFTRQVQILCDTAKGAAASLAGKEAPVHTDEEKSLADLKNRLNSVVNYLNSFSPKDFEGAFERKVSRPRWEGKYLTGEEFFMEHVVPNFYFHWTTAYAILRHVGVDVGKKDVLGELPYKVSPQS